MPKTESVCYTQDLPKAIQNVLFEHGEKKLIGQSQWLRSKKAISSHTTLK